MDSHRVLRVIDETRVSSDSGEIGFRQLRPGAGDETGRLS